MIKNLGLNLLGGVSGAVVFIVLAFLIERSGYLPAVSGEEGMNFRFFFFAVGYTLFVIIGCSAVKDKV